MTLYEESSRLFRELDSRQLPYALCGGLAMAVHGFPRATMDIDLLVASTALNDMRALAVELGYIENPRPLPLDKGRIVLHRFVKVERSDYVVLDVILASDALPDLMTSRLRLPTDFGGVWVLTRSALARMKSLRNSGVDQEDIKRLMEESPDHED